MQPAREVGELFSAVLALTVGRVAIEHGRRRRSCMIALVAQIDPESAGLGLAGARRQNVDRRVIGVDDAPRHHVFRYSLDQRTQQPRDVPEPLGELAAIDVEPRSRVNLGLPIERKMVAKLRHHDVGEETRVDHAARNRQIGHRCLHHGLALSARAGRPHVTVHLEARRDVGQHLGDSLAHRAQLGPAAGFAHAWRRMHDVAA